MYSKKLYLTPWEKELVIWYAAWTEKVSKRGTSKKHSSWSEFDTTAFGKAHEIAVGTYLGAWVDITIRSTGDGHRDDLVWPYHTGSLKSRSTNPAFIMPYNQGETVLDDIALVSLSGRDPFEGIYIVGGFLGDEWDELMTYDNPVMRKNGLVHERGVPFRNLTKWDKMNEKISIAEARGRERGIRQRLRSGRMYVLNGQVRAGMDDEV